MMEKLSVPPGDIIAIKGTQRTLAKCLPLYPSDELKGIIRIDGLIRQNASISIGDTVTIRRVNPAFAEKLVLLLVSEKPDIIP